MERQQYQYSQQQQVLRSAGTRDDQNNQKQKFKDSMNKHEWTPALDKSLQEIVLRNYFNFDMVSVELNEEARRLGLNFGATHAFTNEKCRIRWSYLHLKRQSGKPVKYKTASPRASKPLVQTTTQQEPTKQAPPAKPKQGKPTPNQGQKSEPLKNLENKPSFDLNIDKSRVNLGNLEQELWKKNVTRGPRTRKDYLDVSNEDFTRNTSLSIDGKEITPSNFNIFRDSLRQNSEQLLRTLQENLPEMNLREIEEEEQRRLTDREDANDPNDDDDDDDEDVVPLDFRTALIEHENKVVIQAKPLALKTDDDLLRDALEVADLKQQSEEQFETMESYLEAVKKEPFRADEENVIMIDPDINIKEKFEQIDLACNREQRINNTFNAPVRSKEQIATMIALAQAQAKMQAPVSKKQYDTDTDNGGEDNNTDTEKDKATAKSQQHPANPTNLPDDQMPLGFKRENLDFNNILKSMGVSSLNKLMGMPSSSEDESKKKKEEVKKEAVVAEMPLPKSAAPVQQKPGNVQQRVGLIESIMSENRQAQKQRQEADALPQSIEQMFKDLQQQSGEDSDIAPMSALVDTPTKEEVKDKERRRAERSLMMASASSEDESANERKKKMLQKPKKVTFEDQKKSESETEMINTSSSKPPAAKTSDKKKQQKVQTYKGVKIQSDNEEEKASRSSDSNDSAEDYFNQQRKMIRNKLTGNKDLQNQFSKDDFDDQIQPLQERQWDDEDAGIRHHFQDEDDTNDDFDRLLQDSVSEAKRVQDAEQLRAREEAERLRVERLRVQSEMLRAEQEKKQRERDELRERLKRQDEERKQRKKEEKAKRDQEKELKRAMEEERARREEEEKERVKQEERKKKQEEERAKRDKEENALRKETFERSIRKIWNGSDVPCLFDPKIAYSRQLYTLPVELEEKIMGNQIPQEDLVFRRYKVLLIPLDNLLAKTSGLPLIELTNYFLRYSTLRSIDNFEEEGSEKFKTFPFKCIGFVQSVAVPPFNKCGLSAVNQVDNPNAQRVLTLLFDTHDGPKVKHNFNETLKLTKLSDALSPKSMSEISQVYPQYLEKMAFDYMQANKVREFPYALNVKAAPLIEFENSSDLVFNAGEESEETLNRITFFMEYSVQDDVFPMMTKESWEFLRRYPTFYAFNPNPRSYSRIDSREHIRTKYNQFHPENVCVIFKDLTMGKVTDAPEYHQPGLNQFTQSTKAQDSLSFFLKKATISGGLEICGMRLIYMDKEQIGLYEHLFNEKLFPKKDMETAFQGTAFLALFLRGIDAINKCEQIIGHFNPEMARKTNEKSVRAFFGRDKEYHNCVLKMFASQKKNMSELIFWFGGRVQQEQSTQEILQSTQTMQVPISTMYLVVPPKIEKQVLFLSPMVTTKELPGILQTLVDYGVTIMDVQRINYDKFNYEGEGVSSHLNRHFGLFRIRGTTFQVPTGFVLKLAREGLLQKYRSRVSRKLNVDVLAHIDRTYGGLVYLTQSEKEYKIVKQRLRQSVFNVNYQQLQLDHLKPKDKTKRGGDPNDPANRTDYDSEDTENFKDIVLYHTKPTSSSQAAKGIKKQTTMTSQPLAKTLAAPQHDTYETTTFLCFLKLSMFRKQTVKELLSQILSTQTHFELLGLKILNAKKELYNELVPVDIRTLFKKVAYKFYEGAYSDLRLRKKITEFKTLVLVLRGRNVDANISKIYDRETLKFLDNENVGFYEGSPQGIFLTNQELLEPLFSFLLNTKLIKLYHDFAVSHEHLMDSPVYSYMLKHNVERCDPTISTQISDPSVAEGLVTVNNIVQIKSKEQLADSQDIARHTPGSSLSACICVVKPNQPINVALRTLKAIANNKELGLTIQQLEFTRYDDRQIELLYKHDIEFDQMIQSGSINKEQYARMFKEAKNPVVQFVVTGPYAIAKLKQIIGHREPKQAAKDSLRSFYGVDRLDNAYFISENFSESLLERDYLFSSSANTLTPASLQSLSALAASPKKTLKATQSPGASSELALVLFAPAIVASNDFVFVLDDLLRSKFNLCALLRLPTTHILERADLEFLFQDQRNVSVDFLEQSPEVFKREGGVVMAVVEREKAVQEASEVVGRLGEMKSKADFERLLKKSKASSSSSSMMMSFNNEQQSLINEYGPYIFTFPIGGAAANQRKILRYFNQLPNSQNFEIVQE